MSVMIETDVGSVVVDLFYESCPIASRNFLKLCKLKYYNNVLFYHVEKDFIAQTGDPSATGTGGSSVWGLLKKMKSGKTEEREEKRFFGHEIRDDPEDLKDPKDLKVSASHSKAMPTVYYDGSCPLCVREIKFYRSMAGSRDVIWQDVSASSTSYPATGLSRDEALERFHVKTSAGALLSGAAAVAHLWLSLPGWRLLGTITGHRVVLPFAEAAYRLFLMVRPALQAMARKIDDGQSSSSK